MIDIITILNRIPKLGLFLIVVILIFGIGVIDLVTGYEISFSLFYLVPIIIATWFISRRMGVFSALMSMLIWAFAEGKSRQDQILLIVLAWNAGVRFGFFAVTVTTLSHLKVVLERERKQARIDYLTGITNSRSFYELTELEVKRMARYKRAFTVAYIDIDNFKSINDTFGHKRGDELLRMVAKMLKKTVRNIDIVARIGGDEFVILLSEMNYNKAHEVLARINSQLQNEMQKVKYTVTFSIGATTYITPPNSIDDMIKRVDALMYAAKNDGKNMIKHKVYNE